MRPRLGSMFSGYGGLDLAIAEVLDAETVWLCTRWSGHGGPCALMPRWWNIKWRFFVR